MKPNIKRRKGLLVSDIAVPDSTVFWRQLDIIDTNKIKNLNPTLIGVGGLGSPTAIALSKMGVEEMTIYDPDVVDIHNVPNQMYSVNDIGQYKVDAIAEFVGGFGTKVNGRKTEYHKQGLKGVVIVSVDTMKARKAVWESAKFSPNIPLLIDMRMGAEVGRIFTANPTSLDSIKFYEENLYDDEDAQELPCTAQAIIYNTFGMASWACKLVKSFIMGETVPQEILLDMVSYGIYTR